MSTVGQEMNIGETAEKAGFTPTIVRHIRVAWALAQGAPHGGRLPRLWPQRSTHSSQSSGLVTWVFR